MKRHAFYLIFLILSSACISSQSTMKMPYPSFDFPKIPHEVDRSVTATFEETVAFYKALDSHPLIQVKFRGMTDIGKRLQEVVISKDGDFDALSIRKKGKRILLINNAIHPGEPCGVDASMLFVRDLFTKKEMNSLLDEVVIVLIPMYNLGGVLNRSSFSRANQDGPESYGFRGNARNLDLNRDFIKCDSKNAKSFVDIFQEWSPDVFIDNHTSNGADYQYTLTMIPTQHNKLGGEMGKYLEKKMMPYLFEQMKKTKWEMCPYVYARDTPDGGIAGFLDLPRYSSGYTALFHTFGFIPETHMLKPFEDRVQAIHAFMWEVTQLLNSEEGKTIRDLRVKAIEKSITQSTFDIDWELDEEKERKITFKGYEAKYKQSEISGKERLYYDKSSPYEKQISFFNDFKERTSIDKPIAYVIPQAWHEVIDRLQWNGVEMTKLTDDVLINVEAYYIEDFKDRKTYEGHYLHQNTTVRKEAQEIQFYKGDYLVEMEQDRNRFIVEVLEPQAPDSYFSWNFFDSILQQKEYFSSYVFEDLAIQFLNQNPALKIKLAEEKSKDESLANSAYKQLEWIYQRSPYFEKSYKRYPVYRLVNANEMTKVK